MSGRATKPGQNVFLREDNRGTAAVEFAITAPIAILILINVYDISSYISQRMTVQSAAQAAVQAIWRTCDTAHVPATTLCSALNSVATTAIQSTGFGNKITLAGTTEGYYCINLSNALQYVSDVSQKPFDCTAAGTSALKPGDYIQVQAQFTYTPLFAASYAANLFTTPITASAWMRLQ